MNHKQCHCVTAHAVAINPVDMGKQAAGDAMLTWTKYPFVLGNDISGTVAEVRKVDDVTHIVYLKPGDCVVGHAVGTAKEVNKSFTSTFQQYTVIRSPLVAKIPDTLSFEGACVLPLALSTAACGLFMKCFFALQYPVAREYISADTRPAVVIKGGSTSVGINGIQLAKAASYEVFTTASPKNFEYDPGALGYLIEALQNKNCAGASTIGKGSLEACVTIVTSVFGRRFVSQATIPLGPPKGTLGLIAAVISFIWWNLFDSDLMMNEVFSMIFNEFLSEALANRTFVAKPDPQVVGKSLEFIQTGLDTYKQVTSVKKIVISLQETDRA
ncbi:zinc-binding oxidoreductase CipB [Nemania abortiva]|nr:zinc-binding oxidoreductase CipB [Nemania abortiva]